MKQLLRKIKINVFFSVLFIGIFSISQVCTYAAVDLSQIPAYSGNAFTVLNDNVPEFDEMPTESFETYGELDSLGRCTEVYANIGQDLMPTKKRGDIGHIKPTGWQSVQYDFVDGKSLYNRCHLIAHQLTAENDNEKNLITGTRYLNVEGMLPFENMVADYIKETDNHVLYRVTPLYAGDNLVAHGVVMEAMSVEDEGEGILFHVFCYNVQPGVGIDYSTGDNWLDEGNVAEEESEITNNEPVAAQITYILNMNTKKFHLPGCKSVKQMNEENKGEYSGSREELINMGYTSCKNCNS